MASELIAEAITDYFGERCLDYAAGCPTCEAWAEYDRWNTRPAPAATDTGLETWKFHAPVNGSAKMIQSDNGEWVPLSQAEELLAAERAEKEEARRAEEEAKDCFWSIYETYLEKGGLPVSTEGARSALSNRIASLEADNAAKDERIKELEADRDHQSKLSNKLNRSHAALEAKLAAAQKALEPFADHAKERAVDAPEWRDTDTVQIVVTIGDLRAARAVLGVKPS